MEIKELIERNNKFISQVSQLPDLFNDDVLLGISSELMKSARNISKKFASITKETNEMKFNSCMTALEDETDEVMFQLDRLERMGKKIKNPAIDQLVKEGYDLLAGYAIASDFIVSSRTDISEDII